MIAPQLDTLLAVAGSVAVLGGAALVIGGSAGVIPAGAGVPVAGVVGVTVLLVVALGWKLVAAPPHTQPLADQPVERVEPVSVLGSSVTAAVEAGDRATARSELAAAATATLTARTGADEAACRRLLASGSWTTDPIAAGTVGARGFPLRHRLYSLLAPRRAFEHRVERTLAAIEAIDEQTGDGVPTAGDAVEDPVESPHETRTGVTDPDSIASDQPAQHGEHRSTATAQDDD